MFSNLVTSNYSKMTFTHFFKVDNYGFTSIQTNQIITTAQPASLLNCLMFNVFAFYPIAHRLIEGFKQPEQIVLKEISFFLITKAQSVFKINSGFWH